MAFAIGAFRGVAEHVFSFYNRQERNVSCDCIGYRRRLGCACST